MHTDPPAKITPIHGIELLSMLGEEDVDVQTSGARGFLFDDPAAVLASPADMRCTRVRYSPAAADEPLKS